MTTSYDQNRDVVNAFCQEHRGIAPARFAQAITPSDSTELGEYGRILITNSHATATQNIVVIDDTTTVMIPIAPLTTIYLPIVVRRVMASGTGANISAVLLT